MFWEKIEKILSGGKKTTAADAPFYINAAKETGKPSGPRYVQHKAFSGQDENKNQNVTG